MILQPKRSQYILFAFIQNIKETWSSRFRIKRFVSDNLFVDISTYGSAYGLNPNSKPLMVRISLAFIATIFAYNLNNELVFKEEELDTITTLKGYMAFGFLFTGLLYNLIFFLSNRVGIRRNKVQIYEEIGFNGGIGIIISGSIFILLFLLKFFALFYLPGAFDAHLSIGIFTFYILQALFFLGFLSSFYLASLNLYTWVFQMDFAKKNK